jgi:WD40 repeat protein
LTALMGTKIYKFYPPFKEEPLSTSITWGASIYARAYLPGQNLYATSDFRILFWNAENGEQVRSIQGMDVYSGRIMSLEFSPDEKIVAGMCTDGIVRFWDVPSGKPLGKLPGSTNRFAAAFSPDGRMIATVSESNDVLAWVLK